MILSAHVIRWYTSCLAYPHSPSVAVTLLPDDRQTACLEPPGAIRYDGTLNVTNNHHEEL